MHRQFLAVILFAVNTVIAAAQDNPARLNKAVTKLGNKLINEHGGAALSIGVYHAGQASFYNFGTVEKAKQELPTENSVYEIGSLTKTFVSLLLAKAAVDKKISLDDDVRKYLDGNYPNLEYDHHPITVLHLANTTSGLPDVLPAIPEDMLKRHADSASFIIEKFYSTLTNDDFYRLLHTVKLDTVPGYYPKHSNAAAQLLGLIIEKVYKKPISQLLDEFILSPLNIKNTSFASYPADTSQMVKGYDGNGNRALYLTQNYMQASGGLRSTTADLVKYAAFFLDNKSPLTQSALKKTIEISAATNKVVSTEPGNKVNPGVYAASLNWWHYNPGKGQTRIWADGGTPGFCSYIVFYPEAGLGIVILSSKTGADVFNALPGIAGKILEVFPRN